MLDRESIRNRGTAGWRPISLPAATLVARPHLVPIRDAHDRGRMLDFVPPRRHRNSRSTI
jgi:hypothetical protein